MDFNKYDMFAYQLLDYLVIKYNYQVIRVQQHKDDIWLMSAKQESYPVICISSRSNDCAVNDTDYIRNVHRVILNLIQREGPILILNTNPQSTPIENRTLTQIRITPNSISNDKILSVFHGLKDVLHEREDVNAEIAELSKEVEEIEMMRQQKLLEEAKERCRPKVTMGFIIISVILSLITWGIMLWQQGDMAIYVVGGAYYKMNIIAAHEFWRLLSSGFLHQEPIILALTMAVFFFVGRSCEHLYKKRQYVMIILLSIIVGNLFALVSDINVLSMGIGSAVYGIIGAYLMHIILHRAWKHPIIRYSFIKTMIISLILLLFSGLSLYSYLGGFVCGIFLGVLFSDVESVKRLKQHTVIASLLLLLVTCYLGFRPQRIEPIDKEMDRSIINIYQQTFLNKYADYLEKCYNKQYRLE